MTGGAGKIVAVAGSVVRMLKLLSIMCLTREVKGWYVSTRAILPSFSRTRFAMASWRVTEDTLSREVCSIKVRGIATALEKGGHFVAFLQEFIILRAKTANAQELGIGNAILAVFRVKRGVM